jgi:hypothetical protein
MPSGPATDPPLSTNDSFRGQNIAWNSGFVALSEDYVECMSARENGPSCGGKSSAGSRAVVPFDEGPYRPAPRGQKKFDRRSRAMVVSGP